MRTPARILIVDDQPMNVDILQTRLAFHGYEILTATDGEEALAIAKAQQPDLILLDIMMPKMDGIEVCRHLKADAALPFMPIIMVTAKVDSKDVVAGLEAGADEYLAKPVDQAALVARVKSMLRIKELHDTVQEQATQLATQTTQLAEWNRTLEQRVQEQVTELERMGRLKRFFSPQLAEVVVSSGGETLLQSHRREVTVVFCDLRGFTAFTEATAPQRVMEVLRDYHTAMGTLVFQFEGTLERFAGDGMMVFFNDPLPCPDPAVRAVRMAVAMRQHMGALLARWRQSGSQLHFGVGIAHGDATLGMIGFEGRVDYAAIGPVTNLAARLCDEAQGGQILISQRVLAAVEELVYVEPTGALSLKGLSDPVPAFNVVGLKTPG
ncbi:MAG: response regulator [Candidatus Tectomicrobia bacterium]